MLWHLVLLKPRANLTTAERRRFGDAFREAVSVIPSVRAVRFGRRDDRAGLQAYLGHDDELAAHFGQFLSAAIVYDFEMLVENGAELRGALEPLIES